MLIRNEPFREFDRLAQRMLGLAGVERRSMSIEAVREGDCLCICFDLPGVKAEDIELTLDRNMLEVKAERRRRHGADAETLVDERPEATMYRQVQLSESLDTEAAEATYEDGVLSVRVPLSKAAQPRRIDVSGGSSGAREVTTVDQQRQAEVGHEARGGGDSEQAEGGEQQRSGAREGSQG